MLSSTAKTGRFIPAMNDTINIVRGSIPVARIQLRLPIKVAVHFVWVWKLYLVCAVIVNNNYIVLIWCK